MNKIIRWDKSTHVFWTCKELFGYIDLWDNNVGGCESHFYGICRFERNEQQIPCVFCPMHK